MCSKIKAADSLSKGNYYSLIPAMMVFINTFLIRSFTWRQEVTSSIIENSLPYSFCLLPPLILSLLLIDSSKSTNFCGKFIILCIVLMWIVVQTTRFIVISDVQRVCLCRKRATIFKVFYRKYANNIGLNNFRYRAKASPTICHCSPKRCTTISDHAHSEFPQAKLYELKDFHPRISAQLLCTISAKPK